MPDNEDIDHVRRELMRTAAAGAVFVAGPALAAPAAEHDKAAVLAQIPKMHDENVKRLQDWIAIPSIAAENRNFPQGAEYMAALARKAGFADVKIIPTSGKPGVVGRIDAGARTTIGVYLMYDVAQFEAEGWTSPPLEGRLVDKEGLGAVCVGRGAVSLKGPENAFLSALMAFRAAGRRLPVNLMFVCEGEEEDSSPHLDEIVFHPQVLPELRKCSGIFMPQAGQDRAGGVEVMLGAKGLVELELISSGPNWGRGPSHDLHSARAAQVDSPAWRLVQALSSLVEQDGHTPAVHGFFELAKPLTPAQEQMVRHFAARVSESVTKRTLGVERWIDDKTWVDSLIAYESQPTINIQGLVAGYTGPGSETILPARATAKIDMRLVPNMTMADTLAKLKAHLARQGFPDIEVKVSGGYDPMETDPDSKIIRTQIALYRKLGVDPLISPRAAGSLPGDVFTGAPLHLPMCLFGLGYGSGGHASDEYYLIDSRDPKLKGLDDVIASFVEFLYALA